MSHKFKTISGDIVDLKYRDLSGLHKGGMVTGYFIKASHSFPHGFWNKKGEAVYVHGLGHENLTEFNLVGFSEEIFWNMPLSDEEGI